jgi:glycosyltransferase involved in cell wall biosynthesis
MENNVPKQTNQQPYKKKILIFIPEFPVLTETFIEREISKLAEFRNHEFVVFSLRKGTGALSQNLKDKVIYGRLTWFEALKASFYFLTKRKGVIDASKIVLKDNSRGIHKRIYLFLKSVGYTKLFEYQKPDHIHAHFMSDPATICMVASIILEVPFSISAHAKDVLVDGTLMQEKAANAKFIAVCNSYAWKRLVEEANQVKASGKIRLMYHGVDENVIFGDPLIRKKPKRPSIFLGGTRLVEKKGIRYVIEASQILKDRGVSHQFDVVGPGPLYEALTRYINELGVQDNVFIHGGGRGLPFKEVAQFYRTADIFLLPSIVTNEGDADGVPNVVVEAALAKLPLVVTASGGISDVVTEQTGIIIPDRDSGAIADVVEHLIFNPEVRRQYGELGYAKVKEMFDLNKNVSELDSLF